jgi:hypothetical protein
MAIAKRPSKTMAGNEKAAGRFEQAAGKAPISDTDKTPVLFRFRNDFLHRIDAAAKKHELPRQAWVRTVIADALNVEGF